MQLANDKIPVYSCIANSANHAPLALGLLTSFTQTYRDGSLKDRLNILPRAFYTPQDIIPAIEEHGPGVFLFSDYLWSVRGNLAIADQAAKMGGILLSIHGGPSAPSYEGACRDFFMDHDHVDVTVRAEGEIATAEILAMLAQRDDVDDRSFLSEVAGITFRKAGGSRELVRTPDRSKTRDLAQFPSPYLTGAFDAYDLKRWHAAIVETNRGCPYGCTFCDWGSAIMQKIAQFSMDRIEAELEWITSHQIPIIWLADANFGIFERDVHVAETIGRFKDKYGFPKQIAVSYAKNATKQLAEIIRVWTRHNITAPAIIAIQTTDQSTLKRIRRSNIKTKRYEELVSIFKSEKLPMSSDVMIGLPGTNFEAFKNDLQFFFDRQVLVRAFRTLVLPNSPMADPDYIKEHGIVIDETGFIAETNSYTRAEMARMLELQKAYAWGYGFSLVRYLLFYLQADHGIKAMDYLARLADDLAAQPERLPHTNKIVRNFFKDSWETEHWESFYREIAEYTCEQYSIANNSCLDTIMTVQRCLMPARGRSFPDTLRLPHDLDAYMANLFSHTTLGDYADAPQRPLDSFPPGELVVTDPYKLCETAVFEIDRYYDTTVRQWELTSSLMFDQNIYHKL